MTCKTKFGLELIGHFKTSYPFWDNKQIDFRINGIRRIYANTELYSPLHSDDYLDEIMRDNRNDVLKKIPKLFVKIAYYPKEKKTRITIEGSLRKWFFGSGSTRDMSKSDLKFCLRLIAEKIGCPLEKVEGAKIYSVELGMNLRFKKETGMLVDGFVYSKGMKRVYKYDGESVCYENEVMRIKFYDKLLEIMTRIKKKKHLLEKLNKAIFVCRFEVTFKIPKKASKGLGQYLGTMKDMVNNWDDVVLGMSRIFDDVEFIPFVTPVSLQFFENESKHNFEIFKSFLVTNNLGGIENYIKIIGSLDKNNARKYVRQETRNFNDASPELRQWFQSCKSSIKDVRDSKQNAIAKILGRRYIGYNKIEISSK